jgi:hypothetical protein
MKSIAWLKDEKIHDIAGGPAVNPGTGKNNVKVTLNQKIDTGDKNSKYKNKQNAEIDVSIGLAHF